MLFTKTKNLVCWKGVRRLPRLCHSSESCPSESGSEIVEGPGSREAGPEIVEGHGSQDAISVTVPRAMLELPARMPHQKPNEVQVKRQLHTFKNMTDKQQVLEQLRVSSQNPWMWVAMREAQHKKALRESAMLTSSGPGSGVVCKRARIDLGSRVLKYHAMQQVLQDNLETMLDAFHQASPAEHASYSGALMVNIAECEGIIAEIEADLAPAPIEGHMRWCIIFVDGMDKAKFSWPQYQGREWNREDTEIFKPKPEWAEAPHTPDHHVSAQSEVAVCLACEGPLSKERLQHKRRMIAEMLKTWYLLLDNVSS